MIKKRNCVITLRVSEETKNRLIKCAFLRFGEEKQFGTMNDFLNHIIDKYLEDNL